MPRHPCALAAAVLAAAAALGAEPETWCGLKVEPEERCAPYERRRDYSYPASIEWDIVARRDNRADADGILDRPFPSPYVRGLYFDRIKGRRGNDEAHGGHRHLNQGTDIEHIVAVAEAHDSGLCRAGRETRTRFARDLDNLTLASPGVNRYSKSDKDAAEWLPPDNRRWYAATIVRVKRKVRPLGRRRRARRAGGRSRPPLRMTTQPHEHVVGAGETLIADVSLCAVPFGWTATAADWTGTTVNYDGSISKEPGGWIEPARNSAISEDVSDYELDPLRFMRFRNAGGGNPVTIRIGAVGRVEWSVS